MTLLQGGKVETFFFNAPICSSSLNSVRCGGAGELLFAVESWCQNFSGVRPDRLGIILANILLPIGASDNNRPLLAPHYISILSTYDQKGISLL